jgi:shikimate dehydrogenase
MFVKMELIPMITGKTRVFFTIADPVEQVRAPEVFNTIFRQFSIDAVMVPLEVAAENLSATVHALFRSPSTEGIALSIPHKPAAAKIVDFCSAAAQTAGAVNAVRRTASGELEGDLFDGLGFVKSLERYAMPSQGKRVLLIGAGGAASAIATALGATGPSELAVFDPDMEKASRLTDSITSHYRVRTSVQTDNDPAGFDLVINASPLGLKPDDPLPVKVERLGASAQVCDILMKNQPTPFLRAAMERGIVAQPGFDMLILQTPLYLDFFGFPEAAAALRADDSAIRELLVPPELRELLQPVT